MTPTIEAAANRWPGVLEALGIDPRFLKNTHGPCPICGGKDRFRFDDRGRGSWYCTHCGAGMGMKLLQAVHGWDFATAARRVDEVVGAVQEFPQREAQSQEAKVAAIRKMLERAHHLEPESPAWLYLERRCGAVDRETVKDLRCLTWCKHTSGGHHPAMLAIIRGVDGRGVGLHRTYLTRDGFKADVSPAKKHMPGLASAGGAVRLGTPTGKLGIAEGIETALCASRLFGLPVWAALSAQSMTTWEPPKGLESVTIFGDHDESFTGQRASYALAFRLKAEGLRVQVEIPDPVGWDWADVAAK